MTAGIWLGQVRQGFNWSDAEALAKQREHIRATVLKYKDHPALLVWALGNGIEDAQGKNGAVWTAINSLAVMVHQLDPQHPTMTVIAEIGGEKVKNIHRLCPEIGIVGINSYAGAVSVGERYKKLAGTKPYILTEYGPAGFWETQKDGIGAFPEPTSTAKGAAYRAAYESAVLGQPGVCVGSYAFLWGQKQEVTSTWFSMFLADGARLAPVDVLQEIWTGKAPANRCGGYDLTGAKKLIFWARGEEGGEVVSFQFGLIPKDKKFSDTGKGMLDKVAPTTEWKCYEISVAGQDLTRIKTGFVWTLASSGKPVVFYLDNIRWE